MHASRSSSSAPQREINVQLPDAFRDLFQPSRYKAFWGGRGGAKSRSFGAALIIKSLERPLRILCAREVQKSIADSVKRLLDDEIERMGLGGPNGFFESTQTEIRTKSGGLFIFAGLRSNIEAVKSTEGIDIAWVEEANAVSQASIDILVPTIRKPNSEIWASWNPKNKTDPIDKMFRGAHPPPDSIVRKVTWEDNPWFPDVLRKEMEWDRARDPEKYAHIWLGEYVQHAEARVFKNWRIDTLEVPADARPYYGADWGFAVDPSVLVQCYLLEPKTLYIAAEAYQVGCEIDRLPALFDKVGDGAARKWPITADSARPETISYMKRNGYPHIASAIKGPGSIEDGVEFIKSYDVVIHPECRHTIDEFTLYSYKVDKLTNEVLPVLEDKKNNVVDACIAEGQLVTCAHADVPIEDVRAGDMVLTRIGYRRVLRAGVTGIRRGVLRLETTAGTVICTPDHEIYTVKGFVRADALRYADEIVNVEQGTWWNGLNGMVEFTGAILRAGAFRIACIFGGWVEVARSYCTEMFGKPLTDQYQLAVKSIISTETPETTNCPIWLALPRRSTKATIRGMMSEKRGSASIWTVFDRSPRDGTPVLRAEPSTERLAGSPTRTLWLRQSPASIAGISSPQRALATEISSAQTPASRLGGGRLGWMMCSAHARNVAKCFGSIAMRRPRRVLGRVLTVSEAGQSERVYDLTIEDQPEFFAGGVLVHNCRYATESIRMALVGEADERDFTFDPSTIKFLPDLPHVYGLDIKGSRISVVWGALDERSDTVYLYGEYVEERARLETWASAIRKRGRDIPGIFDLTARKRTQEQGERLVDRMVDEHLDIFTAEADAEASVDEINSRVRTKQLRVASNLTAWLAEYRAYRRDTKGQIVQENDGLMHATGLLLVSGLSIATIDKAVIEEAMDDMAGQTRNSRTGY